MAGGFSDLSLNIPEINNGNTGQVTFRGDVAMHVGGHLTIDSPVINWAAASKGASTGTVSLDSPYLTIGSSSARAVSGTAASGGGDFIAEAQWAELQGASLWNGFNKITLNSAHDLRTVGVLNGKRDFLGEMAAAANVNLQASQIYPATLTNFTFSTTGIDQQINIGGSNTDVSPLSAGGSLTFQAPVINQGGVVKAPLGNISLIASKSLTLKSGSVTSVSAEGQLIPFGVVQGGLNWLYPLDSVQNLIISTPPTKQVVLKAPVIDLAKGSAIDISGGGDLISSEFKPVKNDFPNFLLPGSKSYDGSFAILPSLASALAPYDPNFMSTWNDAKTGTNYAVGSQVHLSGVNSLPTGDYTILPAYYALLPGAFLITPQNNSQDRSFNTTTVNGLPIVSGYELLAGTAVRDARSSAFKVETAAQMLQNHPQYALYCASACSNTITQQETRLNVNTQGVLAANLGSDMDNLNTQKLLAENFYANKAQTNDAAATPLLPTDSGQISISAQSSLILDGSIDVSAPGGRGARMDIAADNIEVVNSLSATTPVNTLQILDSGLNNLKVDSLFLGGSRTVNQDTFSLAAAAFKGDYRLTLTSVAGWAKGDILRGPGIADGAYITNISGNTVTLNSAVIGDVASGALITDTKPSLINGATNLLVTSKQVTFDSGVQLKMTDLVAAAARSVNVKSGASLTATGTVNTGDSVFNLIGDSALLRLSADKQIRVNRTDYAGMSGVDGQLTVEAGATLNASSSMLLDSSYSTQMDGNIVMHGGSLNLGARDINIGSAREMAGKLNALNLSNQQLAGLFVDELILNSKDSVNFYGAVGQVDSVGNPLFASDGLQKPLTFKQLVINAAGISGFGTANQIARLQADNLVLENLANATATGAVNGHSQLAVSAVNVTQGPGSFATGGFNTVNLNVGNSFTASGSSNLNIAADTNLNVRYLTAFSGSKFTLDARGHALNVNGNGSGFGSASQGLGGSMAFIADSVGFNTTAILPSGKLTLHATGSSDVNVGPTANIDLAGRAMAFGNSMDYTPGGIFTATADTGSVNLHAGARLDVSSGGGSAAGGSLVLNAVNEWVNIDDNTDIKGTAGSAQFDVSRFKDTSFDKLMAVVNAAGMTESIDFRSRSQDITSSADINAKTVTLTADQGKINFSGKIHADGITGSYFTAASANTFSSVLTLANTAGLQVGDHLIGTGLAENTSITKISGNNVSLSAMPMADIALGSTITDVSAIGASHWVKGLNQTTSNVISVSASSYSYDSLKRVAYIDGVKIAVGDTVTGAGLSAGTTIAFLPDPSLINGATTYGIVLSALPTASIGKGTKIADITSGATFSVQDHDNTWTHSNVITLESTTGLRVGDYLLGAGLAANTTITAISGNNVTLSTLPKSDIVVGGRVTTVDASRVGEVNGGTIKFFAGDTIKLKDGSVLSADSALGKGGQVLLSSLTPLSSEGAIVTKDHSLIDVGGVSADQGGSVTLRALRDGTGINIHTMAGNVSGASRFIAEGVKKYDKSHGTLDAALIGSIKSDTQAYMMSADISSLANGAMSLRPGVEIDYHGNLALSTLWDTANWRYGANQSVPGNLVIRASGDLTIGSSLTDGFQTGNLNGTAVYDQLMNGKSWSYALAAGADLSSSDTSRVLGFHNLIVNPNAKVRTGTGDIQVNAGGDITFLQGGGVITLKSGATGNKGATAFKVNSSSDLSSFHIGAQLSGIEGSSKTSIFAPGTIVTGINASTKTVSISSGLQIKLVNSKNITVTDNNGTVYNAGRSSSQNPYGSLTNKEVSGYFDVEYPLDGGNLSVSAGGNVNGSFSSIDNYAAWQERIGNPSGAVFVPTAWGIAFGYSSSGLQVINSAGGFQQNIGSFGGGNVSINALGNIDNLEVAMPTSGKPMGINTYHYGPGIDAQGNIEEGTIAGNTPPYLAGFTSNVLDIQGGGNLQVRAGEDLQGGSYYLGQGIGTLSADGAISKSNHWSTGPMLYAGNTQFNINATQGVQLASVSDPMSVDKSRSGLKDLSGKYLIANLTSPVDFFNYTDASSLAVRSLAGDITFSQPAITPSSMEVSAFGGSVKLGGNITLFPSAVGQLQIFAQQNIESTDPQNPYTLMMSDYAPASSQPLPTAYSPLSSSSDVEKVGELMVTHGADSSNAPLHLADLQPASFVTQSGDIKNIKLNTPKLTTVKAGRDISNADITIQNIHNSDVSIIDAGRDLIYPTELSSFTGEVLFGNGTPPKIEVAGPGDVLVKSGRNLDLGASSGLLTVGDKNSVLGGKIVTNPALIRPSYLSSAVTGTDSNVLTLGNTAGLVVGEKLITKGLAENTIITAISGNTVTLSAKPMEPIEAGAVIQTGDTSSVYFSKTVGTTESNQLILQDASGLLVGEQLTAKGLAPNTTVTAISGNTVTLSAKPIQQIDADAVIMQATKGASGSYVADINTGANVTVLTGLQGALPGYVGFLNSDQKLHSYIEGLQKNMLQLESNGTSSAQIDVYNKTIKQYQDLEALFKANKQSATALITEFMHQMPGNSNMTADQAMTAFSALVADKSSADKTLQLQSQLNTLLLPVLIDEIKINGSASAADKSLGNDQGYAAINTFFPGANWKGDVNMYFSTLQTQSGGDINLMVPGGLINAGLAVAVGLSTPKSPDELGVITKGEGSINALVGGDFLVNTSRIFTLDGGDILIWSSHGNIDAGKGAKSALAVPPVDATYIDGNLTYTQSPSVAGSGIRTQGQVPGNVYLFAPQGVVNAAEAGIGGKNVTIAATAVLGAQNISFSGVGTGVPQASTSSLAAGLTGTSNMTAGVSQAAESSVSAKNNNDKSAAMKNAVMGMLSVEILGFGE
ncbi:MAG: filamentous hemagglutinin family protein [Methylomonas sp.]